MNNEIKIEEPIFGKRYLVVSAPKHIRNKARCIGHTGIAEKIKPPEDKPNLNCCLNFDTIEGYGAYMWRTGTEIILLDDQNYIK